jgi:tRNA A64-2'-O-ribosylphosphate transferase
MSYVCENAPTFIGSAHTSINRVLRHLKREEVGLYNCICSVIDDASFVREIANLYQELPVFANIRCGLWYAPECFGTCYFKSTDGHYGNWSFSLTRLNLHLAHLAEEHNGCIIVDATRRGKTFPVRPHLPLEMESMVAGN